jgi:multisubunit Na+/H+ antiporter MnhE subunit
MVKNIWKRLSGPVKIGIFFGGLAIVMAVVGLIKGSATAPLTARSLIMAIIISGGTWGLVSWAIATAAVDVERDVAEAEAASEASSPGSAQGAADDEGESDLAEHETKGQNESG